MSIPSVGCGLPCYRGFVKQTPYSLSFRIAAIAFAILAVLIGITLFLTRVRVLGSLCVATGLVTLAPSLFLHCEQPNTPTKTVKDKKRKVENLDGDLQNLESRFVLSKRAVQERTLFNLKLDKVNELVKGFPSEGDQTVITAKYQECHLAYMQLKQDLEQIGRKYNDILDLTNESFSIKNIEQQLEIIRTRHPIERNS